MSLGDCHSNGWNNSNCGHEEDASVECQPGRQRATVTVAMKRTLLWNVNQVGSMLQ